jgi:hypothetical protein
MEEIRSSRKPWHSAAPRLAEAAMDSRRPICSAFVDGIDRLWACRVLLRRAAAGQKECGL